MISDRMILLSIFWLLSSCSPLRHQESIEKIDPYEVSLDQSLTVLEEGLTGKGKIKFTSPLLGVNSKENYSLRFRFLNHEESRLVLHSHFSGFQFEDGAQIEIYPADGILNIKISTPGFPAQQPIELMPIESGQEISLKVEIHDGVSSGIRVVIWNDRLSYQGEVLKELDQIFLGNHIFDSFDEDLKFLSHGRGMFWGLVLDQTALILAQRQLHYVE